MSSSKGHDARFPVSSSPSGTANPKFPLGLVSPVVRPYLELVRMDKPTGTVLMFWPFAWGLTMAAYTTHLPIGIYAVSLAKFLFGAFIVRSSACTINDIFDRKVDAGVERTKNRPLASGRVSVFSASVFVSAQFIVGAAFFATLNDIAFLAGIVQLIPLFAIYPLLKRVTYWPQAWLGFAMNFGVVIAWAATTGSLDYSMLGSMLAGSWCALLTSRPIQIYACQDKKDDVKVGVRSTALLFGDWIRPLLISCAVTFVAMLAYAGVINHHGPAYFALSVGGTTVHLVWQFATVDLDVPASCWTNFKRNGDLGWIVWGGLMLDYLLALGVLTPVRVLSLTLG